MALLVAGVTVWIGGGTWAPLGFGSAILGAVTFAAAALYAY